MAQAPGAVQAPPPQVPPAPQPNFALSPALVNNQAIDYSTSEGIKLYKAATSPLIDEDNRFNVEATTLRAMLNLLRDRSFENGWENSILAIPNDIADPLGESTNLVDNYGEIELDHIREHTLTYYDQQSRAAQDSAQLYKCLMSSMSLTGKDKVTIWHDQYTIDGIAIGPLLLKVIIRESHIDTNATSSTIRTQLSSLDLYMPTIGNDITLFNQHVKNLIQGLNARGETTNDLLNNLFKGYKAASDKTFVAYILDKESDYDEGQDLEPTQLMTLADNKYKILKLRDQWDAPSAEEEKIIALEAKVQLLEKQAKRTKRPTNEKDGNQRRADKQGKGNEGQAWWRTPPTAAEKGKSKIVKGREYWWCPNHNKWVRHKPSECQGKGVKPDANKDKDKDKTNPNQNLRIAKALKTIMEDDETTDE